MLALGVAACGDDVQVVEPTPPAPPPPPALSASMAPASAEVEVGSSVVFAVNVSGGVAGEASSWSCASSNTGIATVSVTSAGCQATGVAAGGVTITATVSKGNETANVGSQLTVTAPPAPPAFEASIAPESQSVAVGSSVVFAVNTSGGDMMMAASWTCASSDPAIATVETTDAGCQATGVSGGEVTVNVAATDGHDTINLVAQLTVTTDPVDPVQPFSATMAPESATVAVGSDAVFAINTSGGAADATASWTCSSSDDAIATAATTDAGCQATGVAAGGVTINAAVTKGEDSANLAAQLTVTAPDVAAPAFVFITDPTDGTSLEGDVSVKISVERGDQTPMGLSLLVDGEVAAHQSFGMAATPAMDEPAEQAPLNFTLSFDSGEYDKATGAVTYPNGDHTISAELTVAGSENPVPSNNVSVEFDNDDAVHVSIAGLGDGVMNPTTGDMWYGGPDAAPEITAVPVVYSSGPVTALTLLEFCGEDAMTDDEAPFVFTPECDETTTEGQLEFNVGGTAGGKLNWDFEGPAAPHFQPNPNMRESGWVNATVDFLGKHDGTKNPDGWLKYNHDGDASGVGGYAPQLRFSSTTPSIVDGARAATPNAIPTEPTKKDAVCVIATAVDLLGNESKLPSAGKACASAEDYATTTGTGDDATTTYQAGLRAGLDVSPPTIEFSTASPKEDASSLKEFQVQVADTGGSTGKSGLHSDPVLARIELRDADNDIICGDDDDAGGAAGEEKITGECVLAGGLEFNDPLATTDGLNGASEAGYYTFTAVSRDKAGNRSEQLVRTAVNDDDAPDLGLIVGGYDKGSWLLTATLTDNLSIKEYWAEALNDIDLDADGTAETGIVILPREGSVKVDEYNSSELTQNLLETVQMQVFRALQPANTNDTGDDPTTAATAAAILDSIRVVGVDHGAVFVTATDADRKGYNAATSTSLGSTATLARFGLGSPRGLSFAADGTVTTAGIATAPTGAEPSDADAQEDQEEAAERWNDNEYLVGTADTKTRYARDEVFQDFIVEDDDDENDALELRATMRGLAGYEKAVAGVADDPATDDVDEGDDAEPGVEGLDSNPVSRVDFYAAVSLRNVSSSGGTAGLNRVPPVPYGAADAASGNEALVFLGSSNAAGAEDYKCAADDRLAPEAGDTPVDCRKYVWGIDMSGADFLEITGGDDLDEYTIVAIAVNSAGVAILDTVAVTVDE